MIQKFWVRSRSLHICYSIPQGRRILRTSSRLVDMSWIYIVIGRRNESGLIYRRTGKVAASEENTC